MVGIRAPRRVDNNVDNSGPIASDDLERKDPWDRDIEIQPTGDITNGLIRIGSSMKTLGQENAERRHPAMARLA